ncbi:Macrolide export ATP-binding/permease protein MacB [Anoxybacillus sp. BCO1]|nr:Macrolide export ATP-binding/permease protein MacB [Anoxybacillus sp. BCO1]
MFIELQNVTKIYGKDEYATKALSQVSLQIERGEFIAIMGPSGSGKSTLLHIIGCMDVPTEGVYRLEGEDVTRLNDRQLSDIRNKKVSFIFQHFALMTNFTVFENVELPLLKRNMSKKERREKS